MHFTFEGQFFPFVKWHIYIMLDHISRQLDTLLRPPLFLEFSISPFFSDKMKCDTRFMKGEIKNSSSSMIVFKNVSNYKIIYKIKVSFDKKVPLTSSQCNVKLFRLAKIVWFYEREKLWKETVLNCLHVLCLHWIQSVETYYTWGEQVVEDARLLIGRFFFQCLKMKLKL